MDRHTRQLSFVRNKSLQLSETPGVECCALRPSSPHPRANVRQIFDGNRPLCAFGLRNNLFRNYMIDMFGEPRFLTGEQTQSAAASQASDPLQFVPEPPMPIAHVFDRATAVDLSVAIDGDIRHPQVNTQNAFYIDRIGFVAIYRSEQIPFAAHEGKVAFATLEWQHSTLVRAANKGNRLALIDSPNRHRRIGDSERKNTIIICDCGCWTKRALRFGVQSVGVPYFRQRTNNHLRCQPKGFAHFVVTDFLERKLTKRATFPRDLADMVTRCVRRHKRAHQRIRLFTRGQQF